MQLQQQPKQYPSDTFVAAVSIWVFLVTAFGFTTRLLVWYDYIDPVYFTSRRPGGHLEEVYLGLEHPAILADVACVVFVAIDSVFLRRGEAAGEATGLASRVFDAVLMPLMVTSLVGINDVSAMWAVVSIYGARVLMLVGLERHQGEIPLYFRRLAGFLVLSPCFMWIVAMVTNFSVINLTASVFAMIVVTVADLLELYHAGRYRSDRAIELVKRFIVVVCLFSSKI